MRGGRNRQLTPTLSKVVGWKASTSKDRLYWRVGDQCLVTHNLLPLGRILFPCNFRRTPSLQAGMQAGPQLMQAGRPVGPQLPLPVAVPVGWAISVVPVEAGISVMPVGIGLKPVETCIGCAPFGTGPVM